MIDIRAHRQKMTGNEPDAKAILPKPRSVQKANSYQFSYPEVAQWKITLAEGGGGITIHIEIDIPILTR